MHGLIDMSRCILVKQGVRFDLDSLTMDIKTLETLLVSAKDLNQRLLGAGIRFSHLPSKCSHIRLWLEYMFFLLRAVCPVFMYTPNNLNSGSLAECRFSIFVWLTEPG